MSLLGISKLSTNVATPRNEYLQAQTTSRNILNANALEQRQLKNTGDALSVISDLTKTDFLNSQGQFDFKLTTSQVNDLMKNPVGREAINTLANVHSGFGLIDGIAADGSVTRNNFSGFSLAPPNEDGSQRLGEGGQPVYIANVQEDKPGALSKIFSIFGTPNDDDPAVTFTADKLTNIINSGIGISRATGRGLNASDNFGMNTQLIDGMANIDTPLNSEDISRTILAETLSETLTGNSPEENAAKRDAMINIISDPKATAEQLTQAAIEMGADPARIKQLQGLLNEGNDQTGGNNETPSDTVNSSPAPTSVDARIDAMLNNSVGGNPYLKKLRQRKEDAEKFLQSKEGTDFDTTVAEKNLERINEQLAAEAEGAETFLQERIDTLSKPLSGRGNTPAGREKRERLLAKAESDLAAITVKSSATPEQQERVEAATVDLETFRGNLLKEVDTLLPKLNRDDAAAAAQLLRQYGVTTREDLMRLDIPTKEAKYIAAAFAKYGERKTNQTPQELYRETLNFMMYGDASKTAMDRVNQRIDAEGKVNARRTSNRAARQDQQDLNFGTSAEQSKFQELQGKIATLSSNPDTFNDPSNTTKGENLAASLTGHIRELNALFQSSPAASTTGTRFNKLVSDSITAAETNRVIYELAYGGSDGIKEWFRDVWRSDSPGGDWIQNPASLFVMSADGKRIGVMNTATSKDGRPAEVYEGTMTVARFRQLMPQTADKIIDELKVKDKYR